MNTLIDQGLMSAISLEEVSTTVLARAPRRPAAGAAVASGSVLLGSYKAQDSAALDVRPDTAVIVKAKASMPAKGQVQPLLMQVSHTPL
jgi:hypothetical protein